MTSIRQLIGLDDSSGNPVRTTQVPACLESNLANDYSQWAIDAKHLDKDVRIAYLDLASEARLEQRQLDRHFLERASEFVHLNDQVETSTHLLTELATFLETFQKDLSAVSGHISELQGRSKTIEGRLQARKAVDRALQPFLSSITISPSLVHTIVETEPSRAWIPAIIELDERLGAVRGGARVESRKKLDEVAEALRVTATSKIVAHLTSLLRPYTSSLSSLAPLHASLSTYKPLFDFVRRHSARQAHDVQKNYVATTRWYYETAFRRYVRTLEGLRVKSGQVNGGAGPKWDGIATVATGSEASLALLNAKKQGTPRIPTSGPRSTAAPSTLSAIANSRLDDEDGMLDGAGDQVASGPAQVIPGYGAVDKAFKPSLEQLFRSISLVLASNCESEYGFIDSFFGTHSTLSPPPTANSGLVASSAPLSPSALGSPTLASANASGPPGLRRLPSNGSISAISTVSDLANHPASHLSTVVEGEPSRTGPGRDPTESTRGRTSIADELERASDSGKTVTSSFAGPAHAKGKDKDDKVRRVVVESVWKSVMEPAIEYAFDLIHAILTPPSTPSPLALLSMIRLNSALLASTVPRCPPLEAHLYSVRILLWPLYTRAVDQQTESLRKINGSTASSGGGMLGRLAGGGGPTVVKDSTVQLIVERYIEWFKAVVEMSRERSEEDKSVFHPFLRLRQELDRLLVFQASRIPDSAKQTAFLRAGYQELVSGLSTGLARHERVQREVAHYRELARALE
ncbi:hypothetical protein JCM10212_006977 [Sporobolomyces blumeae]